ncbi:hypothetical protein ASG88_19840 [Nocardioides sp. Soil777]|uniref:hypothetical protein n=1 Tax=Nocardioides sp. Soil777 TaxID=1736409 RepID=UPI00070384F7|nr:hypothetical protein [Nocardioides sp. Soil777]KRF06409.1 hypothetical protein ASG88_19840 [Nocardioides sp. Soil777]
MSGTGLVEAPARAEPRFLKPGWPLAALYLGFPLWWALGLAGLIFFVAAAVMAVIMYRQGSIRVPRGFALWLLFLVWTLAGVLVLRAIAPGTLPGGGVGRYAGFLIWFGWYVSITIAMLYVLNTARHVSTLWIVRVLAWMFVVTTGFGLLAILVPTLEFTSPMELLLPQSLSSKNFVRTLIHPSLSSSTDFLGYVQPRPTAPFAYSNSWGNNLALYLPFFMLAWFGRSAGWRRKAAPFVLVAAVFPITFSLNRGLWVSLVLAAVYAAGRLALNGRWRAMQAMVAAILVGGLLFAASPLYDTLLLRVETPHSNDRRAGTAQTVVSVTAQGSPLIGYGTTRTMQGSFSSLAGGETEQCHQCAAPPLGTQGFMWRLILTTGFVGTFLCLAFFGVQFLHRARGPSPLDITGCTVLLVAVLCFFFYDSLGSAMFTALIAIGLMARADLPAKEVRHDVVG